MPRVSGTILAACLLSLTAQGRDLETPENDASVTRRPVLEVGGLFPFSGASSGGHGWGTAPAVTLALAHVNAHPEILPSHTLHMTRYDTQVWTSVKGDNT